MLKIDRNALAEANIAGGATKNITITPPDGTPATVTASGSMTSTITVNGQTVMNQTVKF